MDTRSAGVHPHGGRYRARHPSRGPAAGRGDHIGRRAAYTGGRFGVAGFEQGTETRRGQAGWITIEWTRDASQFCGFAHVGLEGGGITFTYDQPGCSCGSQKIRARTVKHELGHAMGIWHTGQSVDLMSGIGVSECDRNMTARELQFLDYLYRRPVGNTDPDNDPSAAVQLRPVRAFD